MIRVYFVFKDPLDGSGVNISFADVPTGDPDKALDRVEEAAESGELWKGMYPDDSEHLYSLIQDKMMYIDISALPDEWSAEATLAI